MPTSFPAAKRFKQGTDAADLVGNDEQIDLALLKVAGDSPAFGTFRTGTPARVEDSIIPTPYFGVFLWIQ